MVHVREYVAYVRLFPSGFRLLRMYVSKFIYFLKMNNNDALTYSSMTMMHQHAPMAHCLGGVMMGILVLPSMPLTDQPR